MNARFRALRHRNLSIFLGGQIFALIGYWIQHLALSWLVYRMTDSPFLLGLTSFAAQIPVLLLAPLAGLWSDRFNRYRLMLATQVMEMIQAALLAAFAFSGTLTVWHVIALQAFLGVSIAIELPVRHAFLVELIEDRADLPNAVALTAMMANTGRLIGPALAGFALAYVSEAACFTVNALSYLPVLASFALMRGIVPGTGQAAGQSALAGMREGALYVWRERPVRWLLMVIAAVSFAVSPYTVLMPVYVRDVLGAGPEAFGLMIGSAGCGALAGTLFLASRSDIPRLARAMIGVMAAAGAALLGLSQAGSPWLAAPLMFVTGFGILAVSISGNMILQSLVPDDKRGRVMSLYTVASLGVLPLGSLAAGSLAQHLGVVTNLLISGACCLAAAAALYRRRRVLYRAVPATE